MLHYLRRHVDFDCLSHTELPDCFVIELDRDRSDEDEQTYYAKSDIDVRKLYECRPRGLKNMFFRAI